MKTWNSIFSLLLVVAVLSWSACNDDDNMPDGEGTGGGGGSVDDQTVVLECGSLDENTVLKNGNAAIDYLIDCSMQINGDVEIEPGTVIAFGEDASLFVESGSLSAAGTEEQPIIFRGEEQESGYWKGIWMASNSSDNLLQHVVIRNAGSDYIQCCSDPTSLTLDDGKVSIDQITVEDGDGRGIVISADVEVQQWNKVRVQTHTLAPLGLHLSQIDATDGEESDYTGNDKDYIEVYGSEFTNSLKFIKQSVPYFMTSSRLNVSAAVSVDPGVIFLMPSGGGWNVAQSGSFKLEGQQSDPIIFTGEQETPGYWNGIYYNSNSRNNVLTNVEIVYAGGDYVLCCDAPTSLKFNEGRATLNNVTLTNGAGHGIVIDEGYTIDGFSNVSISTHDDYPLVIDIENVNELDGLSSDFSGNSRNRILVTDSYTDKPTLMRACNIPYLIDEEIYMDAKLTVEAGTEIRMQASSSFYIPAKGALEIQGTSSDRVQILAEADGSSGFWKGILLQSRNSSNRIEFATIKGAGSTYVRCCDQAAAIRCDDASLTITDTEIADVTGCGLAYDGSSSVTESNISYSNVTTEVCN